MHTCIKLLPMIAVMQLAAAICAAESLRCEPEIIEFHAQTDAVLVQLYAGNNPYPAERMQGWRFMVDDNFYNHMVSVTVEDGKLRVRPTDKLEVGQYTLHVDTPAGQLRLMVKAPLDEHKSVVEKVAQDYGITLDMAKKKLGLANAIGQTTFEFRLLPQYTIGQTLKLETSGPEENVCTWIIDGDIALEGTNERVYNAAFWTAGRHSIHYIETREDIIVAQGEATVHIVEPALIPMQAPVGSTVRIVGAADYTSYRWMVDGQVVSENRTLEYTFREPGAYTLISQATGYTGTGNFDNVYRRYKVDANRAHSRVQFGTPEAGE